MQLIIAHRTRALPGESHNGDAVVVRQTEERTLIALLDGLGHGKKAHAACQPAIEHLGQVDMEVGIEELMRGVHQAMRGTRGAAATVCLVRGLQLEGCGVGNVELRVSGAQVPVVLSPGVLGARVQRFRYFRGELRPGARLLLYSDGLSGRFSLDSYQQHDPDTVTDLLMSEFARDHDDATVVVGQVRG